MNQETTAASSVIRRERYKSIVPEIMQELVGNTAETQNWKGIAISLAVILCVIGFVALSVVLLTPDAQMPVVPKVSLSDILDKRWKLPEYSWVGSGLVYEDIDGNVVKIASAGEKPEVVIPKEVMKGNKVAEYKISSDWKYALLACDKVPIYTYSYNAFYYVYNIEARETEPLIRGNSGYDLQFAGFGPKGSSMVYSYGGNLYYTPSIRDAAKRLTTDGEHGIYQNGIADWLYEEKILKSFIAHWWSPNGRYIAYASFDDKHVDDSYVTMYSGRSLTDISTYKSLSKYKYPKAGYPNPVVNVHAVDLNTMRRVTFIKPTMNRQRLDTFHSLTWLSDDELLITWSNRTMTASVMQQCFPTIATCMDDVIRRSVDDVRRRSNSKSGWLTGLNQRAIPSNHIGVFFFILPSDHGAMGEYNHLAVVNKTAKPTAVKFLTEGNWEVTKLLHYDSNSKEVYYISNERHSGSRHVYKVNMNSERKCLTCSLGISSNITLDAPDPPVEDQIPERRVKSENITCNKENNCKYYDANFGKSSDWFIAKCLGPCLPYSGIVRLPRKSLSRGDMIEEHTTSTIASVQILRPPTRNLPNLLVPSTTYAKIWNEGSPIYVKMLEPASIHVGKRPVVFFKSDVGSQTVNFQFELDLATYVVTHIGAIGIFVDGGGSGGNGERVLQSIAGKPGALEIEDMKSILAHLKPKENIDVTNAGVVGISGYGGYIAALSLTHPEFQCGVARSPIMDWGLYDSFGSESLLGSPSEYPLVYQKTSLLHLIEGIQNSKLRVYHGMQNRDANMQHSVLLEESAMISKLPLHAVKVMYHPSIDLISNSNEAKKIESNIYESISLFLRNCLFGNSDIGKAKLQLLETNYGIPS